MAELIPGIADIAGRSDLRVRIHTGTRGFSALEGAWNAAFVTCESALDGASPQASWWWWAALLDSLEEPSRWVAAAVYDGDELLAAVPSMDNRCGAGRHPVRRLRVPCHGWFGDAFLAVPSAALLGAALVGLRGHGRWDLYRCHNAPASSHLVEAALRTPGCLTVPNRFQYFLPALPLDRRLALTTAKHRNNLKRALRVLDEITDWSIDVHPLGQGRGEDALECFFLLEHAGWKGRAGTSIRARPAQERFVRHLLNGYRGGDAAQVWLLRGGERVLGGLLVLVEPRTVRALLVAYDETLTRTSPGHLLIREVIARHPDKAIDFISAEGWLRPWRPDLRPVSDVLAHGATWLGRACMGMAGLRRDVFRPLAGRLRRMTGRR